ncbi:unnamed protein product, partial [Rotaria sp. Silwood1]
MPTAPKEFEKTFMVISNLHYKMAVPVGGGSLHK